MTVPRPATRPLRYYCGAYVGPPLPPEGEPAECGWETIIEASAEEYAEGVVPQIVCGGCGVTLGNDDVTTDGLPVPRPASEHAREIEVIRRWMRQATHFDAYNDAPFATLDSLASALAVVEQERDQRVQRAIALALAHGAITETRVGDAIPQEVWTALHEEGLLETVRVYGDDGETRTTAAGVEYLVALAVPSSEPVKEETPVSDECDLNFKRALLRADIRSGNTEAAEMQAEVIRRPDDWKRRAEALKRERDELREALREIADRHDRPCGVHEAPLPYDVALSEVYAIARAALAVPSSEGEKS